MRSNYLVNMIRCFFICIIILLTGCEPEITPSVEGNPYVKNRSLMISPSLDLEYKIILPESYDPARSYPALLAIPPGAQSINEVEWAINLYYIRQSIQQDWLVISPVAPNGIRFHEGSEIHIPPLLEYISQNFSIEGEKFHLAGISSGGTSAFRLATKYPNRFKSVTVFPGVPLQEDMRYLDHLIDMAVTMYVGEGDEEGWVSGSTQTAQALDSLGVNVTFNIMPDNGHIISSLNATSLFKIFNSYRP